MINIQIMLALCIMSASNAHNTVSRRLLINDDCKILAIKLGSAFNSDSVFYSDCKRMLSSAGVSLRVKEQVFFEALKKLPISYSVKIAVDVSESDQLSQMYAKCIVGSSAYPQYVLFLCALVSKVPVHYTDILNKIERRDVAFLSMARLCLLVADQGHKWIAFEAISGSTEAKYDVPIFLFLRCICNNSNYEQLAKHMLSLGGDIKRLLSSVVINDMHWRIQHEEDLFVVCRYIHIVINNKLMIAESDLNQYIVELLASNDLTLQSNILKLYESDSNAFRDVRHKYILAKSHIDSSLRNRYSKLLSQHK